VEAEIKLKIHLL